MAAKSKSFFILGTVSLLLLLGVGLAVFGRGESLNVNFSTGQQASSLVIPNVSPLRFSPRLLNGALPREIEARSFLVAFLDADSNPKVLLEKNGRERLPIASITKLITAVAAADYLDSDQEVVLRPEYFLEGADTADLKPGENFRLGDLFYPLLISSSNAAAMALVGQWGQDGLVRLMNTVAENYGLRDTYFYNPTGLDPALGSSAANYNYSTAYDLVKLSRLLLLEHQPLLVISRIPVYGLYSLDKSRYHRLVNTNELLQSNEWPARILGGKTGHTDLAQKNILLVLGGGTPPWRLVVVVLGAADHLLAASQLIDWVYRAYDFS